VKVALTTIQGVGLSMNKKVVDIDRSIPMVCRYWSDFETFVMCFEA